MAIPRTRPDNLPAILSYGFRPFFLLGALYGGMIVVAWIAMLSGLIAVPGVFSAIDWHSHEMLFGFLPAIVTGFLLTAIPNWTGRLPVQGYPLLALVILWLCGRVAIWFSAEIGWQIAMLIDCAFLLAVAGAAGIEIVAGKNWRNLKVLAPILILFAANALFHVEAQLTGAANFSARLGLSAGLVLVMIIGGRIIPSFTRNWLVRENPGRLPVPFNRFDSFCIIVSVMALVLWVVWPEEAVSALFLLVAGGLNIARLGRWAGDRTLRDPLVLILHAAYVFVPLGLVFSGLATLLPDMIPRVAGVHLFGVGAIGAMTLAVMTRSTLGHTGRELHADLATTMIYVAIIAATILRFAAVFVPEKPMFLHLSAALWTTAFLFYALHYGPMLMRKRVKPRRPNPRPTAVQ